MDDLVEVVLFSDYILDSWRVEGNGQEDLDQPLRYIINSSPSGSTDMHTSVIQEI